MNEAPAVLGLEPDEAVRRLTMSGFTGVTVLDSGRRREGTRRVIRQREIGNGVELVVSYFKGLELTTEGKL